MKRGKFALLITAALLAVTAVVVFAASNPQKAQASFSDKLSYMPKTESFSTPELGLIEVKGVVESVTMDTYTVSGFDFRYDGLTIISGAPEVGDKVKVKAILLPDLTRYALKIETWDSMSPNAEFEFYGIVETMDASQWTVSGEQVSVDMAMIDPGIAVGSLVEVEGYIEAGVMVAEKIQLKGDVSAPGSIKVEFFGVLDSFDAGVYMVSGKTVYTDEMTEVKGMLAVGDMVKVEGWLNADGTYLAHEIKLAVSPPKDTWHDKDDDHDDDEIELTGMVESISETVWVIDGMSFFINGSTKIEGSPAVGDMVEVEAYLQSDGSYLAHEIEFEDHDMDDDHKSGSSDEDHDDDYDDDHDDDYDDDDDDDDYDDDDDDDDEDDDDEDDDDDDDD